MKNQTFPLRLLAALAMAGLLAGGLSACGGSGAGAVSRTLPPPMTTPTPPVPTVQVPPITIPTPPPSSPPTTAPSPSIPTVQVPPLSVPTVQVPTPDPTPTPTPPVVQAPPPQDQPLMDPPKPARPILRWGERNGDNTIDGSTDYTVSPSQRWGMWADDPDEDGTILLSIELDRGPTGTAHQTGIEPASSDPPTIRLSWEGGIVGRTTANAYFEGVMEIDFVPKADAAGALSLTASRFYKGPFGADHSMEWNISARTSSAGFGQSGIDGAFYGPNHEGIAGTIFDTAAADKGLSIAIFAGLQK